MLLLAHTDNSKTTSSPELYIALSLSNKHKCIIKEFPEKVEFYYDVLKHKNEKIDLAKEKILRKANEEAHALLQEAKDYADSTIKKYNKNQK